MIPARLKSSRLPYKVLKTLGGKPLLQWVFEAACACEMFDEIVVAVDAVETKELVQSFGARVLMTSEGCLNGTERLIEVKHHHGVTGDIFVNWQADEPFIGKPIMLDLLQSIDQEDIDVWTLKSLIQDSKELEDPNVVKVVVDWKDSALYFSRYSIPYSRDNLLPTRYKHIGIYAYTGAALDLIAHLLPCELEKAESLEQLRFLYHGMKIKAHTTEHSTMGIDLQEHLDLAEAMLQAASIRS